MNAIQNAARTSPEELYLDLLKRCLTRTGFQETRYKPVLPQRGTWRSVFYGPIRRLFQATNLELVRPQLPVDPEARAVGRDWPLEAETMIGMVRLNNIQECVSSVISHQVPGDLIETGVWRGGAVIFMRAVLKAYGDTQRRVWVADSFQGLPKPSPDSYPADAGDHHWTLSNLAISQHQVEENFRRYDLLDDRVRFLPGWFSETLPHAPIEKLAVLRLDGDMYESTIDALRALYPKLSIGGYIIIDDYTLPGCKAAVTDYRAKCNLSEPIIQIDHASAYWQRQS